MLYHIELRVDGSWTRKAPALEWAPTYATFEDAQRDAYHLAEHCDGSWDGFRVVDDAGRDYGWLRVDAPEAE